MSRRAGSQSGGVPWPGGVRAWARRHAYSLLSSLGALVRHPLATLMTVVVLAITLSLPTGLYMTLDNAERISDGWERLDTVSVFLDAEIEERGAVQLASLLSTWPGIVAVDPISPQAGMAELTGRLQLDDLAGRIEANPLPWVLEVTPAGGQDVETLSGRLRGAEGVDQVVVDLQWLERLSAILALLERLAVLLGVLFAVAVAFVIGNTIRMDIHNRREEIRVLALVGATDGFVRRPFLYSGFWYGLGGGLAAWLVVELSLFVLSGPVGRLSGTYASDFTLASPPWLVVATLVLGSGILGVLGAWLAVGRHLRAIHPS
ncbi:permease-like cell division protein FtsX [Wenzhouxiangella sediminis]|uniref:permease-like cell division protein FtsX n=1 Tax=Wenzhouxiangella sediminis TaxID=1792836 RepID=UPI0011C08411|nr:permease-like cell division protein FtsX [Wenzhouxiangella sediminis]